MKTGFFALAVFISVILPPFALLQSLPRSQATKAPAVQSAEAMRAALQPWLRAVAGLLSKTKDPELEVYLGYSATPP